MLEKISTQIGGKSWLMEGVAGGKYRGWTGWLLYHLFRAASVDLPSGQRGGRTKSGYGDIGEGRK